MQFLTAQSSLLELEFKDAAALCNRALDDLKIAIRAPKQLQECPASDLGDRPAKDLTSFFAQLLRNHDVPPQALGLQALNLTHRLQLLRAFADPDRVVQDTCEKVSRIIGVFPRTADHIRRGRNPGDVLDPFIPGAAQALLCAGDFEHTISVTVAHKALTIVEGLLGHLHEDVIGAMRGNVRAPEPRGGDQETLHPENNPFPGADIVQPPLAHRALRFHQVKSKTGSAKGGDGRRLGLQLDALTRHYGGESVYAALIGDTLRGHRSMAGVLRAAPSVVVLVGESAFLELTSSTAGPQLLLRLYQSAFDVAAQQTGYSLQVSVAAIYSAFQQRAEELGEGFLESVLHDATSGTPSQQASRRYAPRRRASMPPKP